MANDLPKIIEGELLARDFKFVIVAARFNEFVVEAVDQRGGRCVASSRRERQADRNGARAGRVRHAGGGAQAGEMPSATMHRRLGAVMRGQTPHFDYVAGECAWRRVAHGTRVGHADRLRRPDHRDHGAGSGPRRRQGRQQRRRCARWPRSRWRICCAAWILNVSNHRARSRRAASRCRRSTNCRSIPGPGRTSITSTPVTKKPSVSTRNTSENCSKPLPPIATCWMSA